MNILAPYLIPFTIPIAVVLVMLLLQLFLMAFAGIGLDFDHDVDLDHEADVHLDHEADHPGLFGKILTPLGLGSVPTSVIWQAFFLGFGGFGIVSSFLLTHWITASLWLLPITIPVSLVAAWHITKHTTRAVAPLFKTCGKPESEEALIGKTGHATSVGFDSNFGEISIQHNNVMNHIAAKPADGEEINQGDPIVVIDYDRESKRPIVARIKE